jgi:hypothetical protein
VCALAWSTSSQVRGSPRRRRGTRFPGAPPERGSSQDSCAASPPRAGWALVTAAGSTGIATFALPAGSLVVILVLGGLAGVIASVRPARRAARLNVLEAIATE